MSMLIRQKMIVKHTSANLLFSMLILESSAQKDVVFIYLVYTYFLGLAVNIERLL